MGHARIGRVRMKSGGADLRILRTKTRMGSNGRPENWNGKIVENARTIAADPDEIVGYAVVAVYANGAYRCAFRLDEKACPVSVTLWPAYLAEVVRREIVTPMAVRETLDDE